MDISRAKTEAAVVYKRRQDELDAHIRVGGVAFGLLERVISGDHGDLVLGALYGLLAEQTKPKPRVPQPNQVVERAYRKNIVLSLAAVQTDFEGACRDLLADALEFWPERWNPDLGKVKEPAVAPNCLAKRGWLGTLSEVLRAQSAGEGFIRACYSVLRLSPTASDVQLVPLFEYFRRCRNRVIHQDGTAGPSLAAFSRSPEIQAAIKSLPASVRRMRSDVPVLEPEDYIVLEPSHCVLFLIVARTIFNALSTSIRYRLDENGYVRMAVHYAYGVNYHEFRSLSYKFVEAPARHFLAERYKIVNPDERKLVARMKGLHLWTAAKERYHVLFPHS